MKRLLAILTYCLVICLALTCCRHRQEIEPTIGTRIQSLKDLSGKKVAVCLGTTQDLLLSKSCPSAKIMRFNNSSELFAAISNNVADYAFVDSLMLCAVNEGTDNINPVFECSTGSQIGLVFRKDQKKYREEFNRFLSQIKQDGTYDFLVQQWLSISEGQINEIKRSQNYDGEAIIVGISPIFPFIYYAQGDWFGFEIALMEAFGNAIHKKIEFVDYSFDALIPALASGKIDCICASMTITEERQKQFDFSDSYFTSKDIIVEYRKIKSEQWRVPNINEIDGHSIALITGSIHDDYVQEHYPHSEIIRMGSFTDILMALERDQCDFIVMDSSVFPDMLALHPNLRNLGKLFNDSVSVAFHKTSVELCHNFNEMLKELQNSGELSRIHSRWFDIPRTEKMPRFNLPTKGEPLRVGIDGHTPHTCEIEGDQYEGYEIELCYRLAERIQRPIEFQIINFGTLIPALQAQRIDMAISSFVVTEERQKKVLFSNAYDSVTVSAITKVKNDHYDGDKNFTQKIGQSFRQNLILEKRWIVICKGLLMTLLISFTSIVFGSILGAFFCWMHSSKKKILNTSAMIYTDILCNVPILVVLMFLFYVVFAHSNISAIWVAIIAFSLHFSALISVVFKTGIDRVPHEQFLAGLSLGFSKTSTFINFIIPQALKSILPVFKNCAISLIKNTSVVGYIAILDLTKTSDIIRSRTFDAFFPLIAVSIIYFILAWLLGKGLDILAQKNDCRGLR